MSKKGATRHRDGLVIASIPQHNMGIATGMALILIEYRVASFTILGYLLDESYCLA